MGWRGTGSHGEGRDSGTAWRGTGRSGEGLDGTGRRGTGRFGEVVPLSLRQVVPLRSIKSEVPIRSFQVPLRSV